MDKYFDKSYDPALDVALPDMTTPDGLIVQGAFDEWNDMLETVRLRKLDKDEAKRERERKRQSKHARGDESSSRHRKDKHRDHDDDSVDDYEKNVENGLKAMGAFVKKQREWDQGKRITDLA